MALDRISLNRTIATVEQCLKDDPALSPALNAAIQLLITAVQLMVDSAGLNGRNSSKPPATDPNRPRKPASTTGRKAGGQHQHAGSNLSPTSNLDVIHTLILDKRPYLKTSTRRPGLKPGRSLIFRSSAE